MLPNDLICRAAVYPKFVKSDIFDDEQFFDFRPSDGKKIYVTSVASRYLLRDENGAHDYGEQIARSSNTRLLARDGNIPSGQIVSVYIGFFDLRNKNVVSIQMQFYSIVIAWRPELNCDAHFQIEMWSKNAEGTPSQRRNDRKTAIALLLDSMSGPTLKTGWANDPDVRRLVDFLPTKTRVS